MRFRGLMALAVLTALVAAPAALAQDTAEDARRHVEFLADDALGGRGTGTEGAAEAARYLIAQLEALGARPLPGADGFRIPFEFTAGVRDAGSRMAGLRHNWDEAESIQALAFSEDGEVSGAQVVFAGYGITPPESADYPYDSYATLDVTDKIVVILEGYPQDADDDARRVLSNFADVRFKAFLARTKGALGILVVSGPLSQGDGAVRAPRAGMAGAGAGIMAASVSRAVASQLFELAGHDLAASQAELDTGNPHAAGYDLGVELTLETKLNRDRREGYNVVGHLPAAAPAGAAKPYVFLGAHYDHLGHGEFGGSLAGASQAGEIHNGADDNASGVAAVLLAGARLAAAERQRHVVLGFWSGEEIGIVGSNAFLTDGALPAREIAGYLNFDMVGRSRDNKLSIQGVGSSESWRGLIERSNFPVGFDLTLTEDPNLPTDSTAFNLAEVPSIAFFTGSHVDYHKPTDDAESINYDDLARVAELGALVAGRVANGDAPEFVAFQSEVRGAGRGGSQVFTGTIPDYAADITGLLLGGVIEGGPAEEAGLQGGDVIVNFGGVEVGDIYDYMFALESAKIGEPLEVTFERDGETMTVTLTPRARE
ncbi:MAG: M28 family peptidase [Acidobacteria bacterium]|nr:M28 family peptidase [Acidobacteriota bacterium]